MPAQIIDGKAFAQNLRAKIGKHVAENSTKNGWQPSLAVIQVGENPASSVYVKNKVKQTEECGMESLEFKMPDDTSQTALLQKIDELNNDSNVDGILVQLPLPKQIDESAVINYINPQKDVDGFHTINVGRLNNGAGQSLIPCTPYGCLLLLQDFFGGDLSGKDAVIVGRSNIVGKPMAQLLLGANATVTIAHSKSRDLPAICGRADIVVAAVGRPEMVKGEWIKEGACVIDVGINRIETPEGKTKLVGDVEFTSASKRAGGITPVPGGVGPMTIAMLLHNTVIAAHLLRGETPPTF
ncbi:MAG: bifunctional methylenetetrahydrofolate dehydrogenase/methenyltetrahydrofolate cyclohydrolase FolD [Alphaproteobacteria bacterium]|nr:bifunctional methylenetetrahydrofolate dehydrogenase/methenyltetrahydrofolate cyclohydrolase FolD [Alphaproteobacteria bacterium]